METKVYEMKDEAWKEVERLQKAGYYTHCCHTKEGWLVRGYTPEEFGEERNENI